MKTEMITATLETRRNFSARVIGQKPGCGVIGIG